MAFCKICACGEKIVFERRMSFPDSCPKCGRRLIDFRTYNENDPVLERIINEKANADNEAKQEIEFPIDEPKSKSIDPGNYFLKLSDGAEIHIPPEGCIVGRTETGAEILAPFGSVSRQHLRLIPRRNVGMIIEDLSTYGTYVDGKKLEKNEPQVISAGAEIILTELTTVLMVKE